MSEMSTEYCSTYLKISFKKKTKIIATKKHANDILDQYISKIQSKLICIIGTV